MRKPDFEALVQEHRGILYKVCRAYAHTADDREDLAQEITVQLWRAFKGFDARYRFSTWMYRIALNVAISFSRRETTRKRHTLSSDERLLTVADESAPSADVALLNRFIEGLEPLNRALILLYLDGYDHAEIAETLGITATNVATKISRLKAAARNDMETKD
ncbi:sigma-70 family RNA polymerase sigma factor [soil metagenome]